jgi:hypothetical protein
VEESGRGLIQDTIPDLPGEAEENHETLSHDSRSPGRDLNMDNPNTKQER